MQSKVVYEVNCPVLGGLIDIGLCSEVQDVYDNMLRPEAVPELSACMDENSKQVCKNCIKRKDPSL